MTSPGASRPLHQNGTFNANPSGKDNTCRTNTSNTHYSGFMADERARKGAEGRGAKATSGSTHTKLEKLKTVLFGLRESVSPFSWFSQCFRRNFRLRGYLLSRLSSLVNTLPKPVSLLIPALRGLSQKQGKASTQQSQRHIKDTLELHMR